MWCVHSSSLLLAVSIQMLHDNDGALTFFSSPLLTFSRDCQVTTRTHPFALRYFHQSHDDDDNDDTAGTGEKLLKF